MSLGSRDNGSEKKLAGRVAIITGASRGIGRALALRVAGEGADVVIAAKSEESSEKLPGSIYSVAEEVKAAGARALAVRCDVRSEEDIQAMVDKTVQEFGKVDILVNNAGVLWWEPVLGTPPKRYELMWQINLRAPYLCSVACLPHMIKNGWGHILMCSPPITLTANPGYVTYMTTKMGPAGWPSVSLPNTSATMLPPTLYGQPRRSKVRRLLTGVPIKWVVERPGVHQTFFVMRQ